MATITKEQVNKLNSKCANGWGLSLSYFITHGEKTLIKRIRLDDRNLICAKLMFTERYNSSLGCRETFPTLHLCKEEDRGAVYVSHGLGHFLKVGENVTRKNTSLLQKLTERFTEEEIHRLTEQQGQSSNSILG